MGAFTTLRLGHCGISCVTSSGVELGSGTSAVGSLCDSSGVADASSAIGSAGVSTSVPTVTVEAVSWIADSATSNVLESAC